jgi:hypothetical protein
MKRRDFLTGSAGGPSRVYGMFEKEHEVTRGPEGIYMHPSRTPGWDVVATPI